MGLFFGSSLGLTFLLNDWSWSPLWRFRECVLQVFRPCGHKVCFREEKDVCEAPSMAYMGTYLPFGKDKSSFPI